MADNDIFLEFDGLSVPFSKEAEQAVLGSILIDPQSINLVAAELKPEFFYMPQHREIYKVLSSMLELGGAAIDFVTVLERLKSHGTYDEAGGKEYLSHLLKVVPSSAHITTYVDIIREHFYARSLMKVAKGIIKEVEDNAKGASELLESAEQQIFDIRSGIDTSGLTHIGDVILSETFDRLGKMNDPETRDDYIGIPTGLSALDRVITGLNKSDMIVLGARPGMGKTSFALNIARNVAMNAGKTVCFFSLEMTRDQLAQRLLSSEAGIESQKLRTGELTGDEWTRLLQAGENLGKASLYFDETSNITVPEMKAKLRRMTKKPGLVIIDYLGLMHSARKVKDGNRVQEISEITRSLKIMAKELKIPVIVCAQLSRATEGKTVKSHKPSLADLRDSGSIEQDADIVLFLYRDAYYDSEKGDDQEKSDPNKATCMVAKNRHGSIEDIPLYWDGAHTRFTSRDVYHS